MTLNPTRRMQHAVTALFALLLTANEPTSARSQIEYLDATPGHEGEHFKSKLFKLLPDFPAGSDEQLARAFAEVQRSKNAAALLVNFGSGNFEDRLTSSDAAERQRCRQHIEELAVVLDKIPCDETAIVVKALLGHGYYRFGQLELAESTFNECLTQLEALEKQHKLAFQPLPDERKLYGDSINRCRIALGLIYCQRKQYSKADGVYRKFMQPFKSQSPFNLYPVSRQMHLETDGNDGQSINALLAKIAQGYADSGHPIVAASKYRELIKNIDLRLPPSSDAMLQAASAKAFINSGIMTCVRKPDPILGNIQPTSEIQNAYLTFAAAHMSLCDARLTARVKTSFTFHNRMNDAIAKRNTRTIEMTEEGIVLDSLKEQPLQALTKMHALIAKRESDSPNKDFIPDTLLIFSRQLMYCGNLSAAESLAREALEWLTEHKQNSSQKIQELQTTLAEILLKAGKLSEAESMVIKSSEIKHGSEVAELCSFNAHRVNGQLHAIKNSLALSEQEYVMAMKILDGIETAPEIFKYPAFSEAARSASEQTRDFGCLLMAADDIDAKTIQRTVLLGRIRCLTALGALYIESGHLEKAKTVLDSAMVLIRGNEVLENIYTYEPLKPLVYEQLAYLAMAYSKDDKALFYLTRAKELLSKNIAALPAHCSVDFAFGKLYARRGNKKDSKLSFQRALDSYRKMAGASGKRLAELESFANQ